MLDVTREEAGIFSFGFFESGGREYPPFMCLLGLMLSGWFLKHIYICALACKNIGFEC